MCSIIKNKRKKIKKLMESMGVVQKRDMDAFVEESGMNVMDVPRNVVPRLLEEHRTMRDEIRDLRTENERLRGQLEGMTTRFNRVEGMLMQIMSAQNATPAVSKEVASTKKEKSGKKERTKASDADEVYRDALHACLEKAPVFMVRLLRGDMPCRTTRRETCGILGVEEKVELGSESDEQYCGMFGLMVKYHDTVLAHMKKLCKKEGKKWGKDAVPVIAREMSRIRPALRRSKCMWVFGVKKRVESLGADASAEAVKTELTTQFRQYPTEELVSYTMQFIMKGTEPHVLSMRPRVYIPVGESRIDAAFNGQIVF